MAQQETGAGKMSRDHLQSSRVPHGPPPPRSCESVTLALERGTRAPVRAALLEVSVLRHLLYISYSLCFFCCQD